MMGTAAEFAQVHGVIFTVSTQTSFTAFLPTPCQNLFSSLPGAQLQFLEKLEQLHVLQSPLILAYIKGILLQATFVDVSVECNNLLYSTLKGRMDTCPVSPLLINPHSRQAFRRCCVLQRINVFSTRDFPSPYHIR